ncbi:MAG: tetratricopeptide repeat protein [Methylophilaceae bacterium]|nr:tetratricopeptide repeat protein [Methylophilaceae bacterium]MBL6729104.1 tetratricopeptide repeat protein [Methylophilaceae bacterium]MBL6791332.1 tetratricopeptide repeat protein [Methylophilaceae bacterium]
MLLFANTSYGVFEDEEARKAINTIQGQLNNIQANIKNYVDQRIEQINKKNNSIQLQNDLKTLQELISKLNGQIEVVQYELSNLTKSQKTLYQDLNERIADLEKKFNDLQLNPTQTDTKLGQENLTTDLNQAMSIEEGIDSPQSIQAISEESLQPSQVPTQESTQLVTNEPQLIQAPLPEIRPKEATKVLPELIDKNIELDAYAEAESFLRATKYKQAFDAFDKFISAFPNSEKIVDAKYGLGYSQYALKNYRAAINTYSKILELHPQDPLVPDAMYGIANCHIQLADIVRAKQTLRDLIQNHPNAEIIPSAKNRLDALNAIKL